MVLEMMGKGHSKHRNQFFTYCNAHYYSLPLPMYKLSIFFICAFHQVADQNCTKHKHCHSLPSALPVQPG